MPWPEIFPRYAIVGVPIVESASAFLSPARYGDIVSIASRVDWVRNRTFRAEHDIAVAGRPCARGFEIRASVGLPAAPVARLSAQPDSTGSGDEELESSRDRGRR